jgi:hypothetical protein
VSLEESNEEEKRPLTARSCPPDIGHDPSAQTKAKPAHRKGKPFLYQYATHLPFDPARLDELEALLKKGLGDGADAQYRISLKRTRHNTVLIEFKTHQKPTLALEQKPIFDKAVESAVETMTSTSPGKIFFHPRNLKAHAFDNVPYGSQLATTLAGIAERILRDVNRNYKVTQHSEKGSVVYKITKSSKFDFRGVSAPTELKADLFIGLREWTKARQADGKSLNEIASNHVSVGKVEITLRKWLSDKYGLDLVRDLS